MKKIINLSALPMVLALAACTGQPEVTATDSSSEGLPIPSQSSSAITVSSSSMGVSSSSVVIASSEAASSSSAANVQALTLQEGDVGFCSIDGLAVETDNDGYTGLGYSNTDNYAGAKIVWQLAAQSSDTFTLEIRFANGGGEARPAQLNINEGSNGSYMLDFPITNAWTQWETETITVDLVQGQNTLELISSNDSGLGNIDFIKVIGEGISGGACEGLPVASSSAASSSTPSNIGDGDFLPQAGNPVHSRYNKYKSEWGHDKADIILSHQYANGGWPKNQAYNSAGSGGNGLGTFDNGATTLEMTFLADVYNATQETKYLNAVRKALDYTLDAQYPSGGWPQYYPLRGGYSDHVTFNDDAMSRILTVLHHVVQRTAPYDTGVITDAQRERAKNAVAKGVDYILKAQWKQNGVPTVWCAQHGKDDYLPKKARAYELESLSGSESVEVVAFLMTQPQTPEIAAAVKAALAWFRSPNTYLADYTYNKSVEEKFVPKSGSRVWFRFYDLTTNRGFFSDRDSRKVYDIMDISEERRNGYSWGGGYGEKIINYANSVGY